MPHEDPDPRFEEALSFLERDIDHIGEQLKDLWSRLEALERRVRHVARMVENSRDATDDAESFQAGALSGPEPPPDDS